jgi:hypothetical protein
MAAKLYEVRSVADGITAAQVIARYEQLFAAKADARSLAATNGEDYEVYEVTKVFETSADPHSARFKLDAG